MANRREKRSFHNNLSGRYRQISDALAGGIENRIGDCRRHARDADLADFSHI